MNNGEIISDFFLKSGNFNNFDFEHALSVSLVLSLGFFLISLIMQWQGSYIELVLVSILFGFFPYIFEALICIIIYPLMLLTGEAEFTLITTIIDILLLIFVIVIAIIWTIYEYKNDKSKKIDVFEAKEGFMMECNRKFKIFRIDDKSWYVAHSLMEFLNWYHQNIKSIESSEDLQELEILETSDVKVWSVKNVTKEDMEKIGNSDSYFDNGIPLLQRENGEIFKLQTCKEFLGEEDITEPYKIASTEW